MHRRFRNLTVTQRLIALTALAMLPAAAVVAYLIASLHQQREREVQFLALQYAQLASLEMERIVSGAEQILHTLSLSPPVASLDPEGCPRYLARVHAGLPQFLGFAVADPEGIAQCTSVAGVGRLSVQDRAYFRQAVETGRFVVGESTVSKVGNRLSLPFALPIPRESGGRGGVIVAALDLDWLGRRLRQRNLLPGSSLTVADRQGVIIAREPIPEDFVGTRIPDGFMHLVRSERPGSIEVVSQDGTRRVLGYYPPAHTGTGLYVSFGLSTDEAFGSITGSTYRSMVIALMGALAVFSIAWFVGQRLFRRPINSMLETVSAWRHGDEAARTGIPGGGSELAVLATAIDAYMDELTAGRAARRRAEEHRELLVRELGHRVKNILSTVQAIASQSFTREDARDSLRAFSSRLSAIAETHQMLLSENWASADLRKTLEIALKPFHDPERTRFTLSGPQLMIHARAALALSMAVHELCTNAVKYGALRDAAGTVEIEWAAGSAADGGQFILTWRERDGAPVRPPATTGFGTRMIERVLAAELSAECRLDFHPAGLECTIRASPASILAELSPAEEEAA